MSGSSRENVGKKGATQLRNQERIPAVLYGGKEQVHFSISENEAKNKEIISNYAGKEFSVFKNDLAETLLFSFSSSIWALTSKSPS